MRFSGFTLNLASWAGYTQPTDHSVPEHSSGLDPNTSDVFVFVNDTLGAHVQAAYQGLNLQPAARDPQYQQETGTGVTVSNEETSGARPADAGGGNDGGGGKGGKGGNDGGDGGDGTLSTYTSGSELDPASSYNVTIEFDGTWTALLQAAFIDAAEYLSSVILADVTDITRGRYATDDITISASLTEIDGAGGILGQAGPTAYRTADYLPVAGIMEFDIADAEYFYSLGLWHDIVFHEMVHTLGFGTLWDEMGLTTGSIEGGDLRFTGSNAISYYLTEFSDISGSDPDAMLGVPIETDGGSGTAGGHWDEVLFVNEIMTGYIDNTNYLSTMSLAALEDMGYDTVIDDPNNPNDLYGTIPEDPVLTLMG